MSTGNEAIDLCSLDCQRCPVGRASGIDRGGFCPWVSREHEAGDVLAEAGDDADYIWFVKDGVVGLRDSDGERVGSLRTNGGFVGLECLTGDRRAATAVVLAPSTLCGATREGFVEWLRAHPDRIGVVVDAAEHDPAALPERDRKEQ